MFLYFGCSLYPSSIGFRLARRQDLLRNNFAARYSGVKCVYLSSFAMFMLLAVIFIASLTSALAVLTLWRCVGAAVVACSWCVVCKWMRIGAARCTRGEVGAQLMRGAHLSQRNTVATARRLAAAGRAFRRRGVALTGRSESGASAGLAVMAHKHIGMAEFDQQIVVDATWP